MRIHVVLLLVSVLTLSVPALAQQSSGDSELQLQGTLLLGSSGEQGDSGAVFVSYGRFFTDRHEAGVSVSGFVFDGDLGGFGGPFYRYNFSNDDVVPYVGAAAGTTFGDFGSGDALLTFEGGVRFFLSRNAAFSVGAVTNYFVEEEEFSDGLNVIFGFSYLWGK